MTRRRLGKKNEMKLDPFDYSLGLLGESGIGKTTLAYEIGKKYLGDDGYILLNIGREEGIDALPGVIYENVETWEDYIDIVDEIVEHKDEYYPNLKVLFIDTLDEMIRLVCDYTVQEWNREHPNKPAKSIKATHGGFMGGEDYAMDNLFLAERDRLKKVGVEVFIIGHTKVRTKKDVLTGEEYDVLDSQIMNRMFEKVKTKLDVLGTIYIDRSIETKIDKDIMGKEIATGKVRQAKRYISFRDDNYSVENKSRFKHIASKVEMDADAFVGAIKDAIKTEYELSGGTDINKAKKEQEEAKQVEKQQIANEKAEQERKKELLITIGEGLKSVDTDTMAEVKERFKKHNISSVSELKEQNIDVLSEFAQLFE